MKNKWYGAEIILFMFGTIYSLNIIPNVTISIVNSKLSYISTGILFMSISIASYILRKMEE